MRKLLYVLLFAAVWGGQVSAQSTPESLKEYVPVLPAVKAKSWKIDPKVGYAVKNVGGGVYVISDNGWQSAFLVTDEGVIVFDAPASFGKSIPLEVSKVTDKTIKLGGKTVELTGHHHHSPEGDLFIYVPEAKFLMMIDSVTSGYAPFQGFDLSTNFHEYLKVFDEILAYKFDTFVGGHLTDIGTRQDVEITKEFTLDVYNTVKRIHNNMDAPAAISEAVKTVGPDNEFLLFKVFLDKVADDSVKELKPRWMNRLAGVDVWLESHVRTAIIYVRWDDKE